MIARRPSILVRPSDVSAHAVPRVCLPTSFVRVRAPIASARLCVGTTRRWVVLVMPTCAGLSAARDRLPASTRATYAAAIWAYRPSGQADGLPRWGGATAARGN